MTANGTANFKAAVTLGASSSNDLTVNAALASSIAIKTDASFDIGATTKGLRAIYLGANSQRVKIAGSATTSASWTLTLPTSAGAANGLLLTDGSGNTSWTAVGQIPGTATNDSASAGNMGEYISASVVSGSAVSAGTTAQFFNVTSISLASGGDYDITACFELTPNGATLSGAVNIAVSQFTGNTTTDHVQGNNVFQLANPTAAADQSFCICNWRISASASSTVYMKVQYNYTGGPPKAYGRISARRAR